MSISARSSANQHKEWDDMPFGWVEMSDSALQQLRRELEQKGQGVVDEMGVLAIHAGYADYFFPGTSVLQSRPRYIFFACWNLLWLAGQRGVNAANILRRKDEADLWVTRQLISTRRREAASGKSQRNMEGIIGARVFAEDPPRPPAQRVDFIYWTAMRRWGFYRSCFAVDRTRLFRRWRGSAIGRAGDSADDSQDDVIRKELIGEFLVPPVPSNWQEEQHDDKGLDFELTGREATWLQSRLTALDEVAEGPCVLAKAADLCGDFPPRMASEEGASHRPWDDPLVIKAAKAAGQSARLERASQASQLGHYVRAIYAALVEEVVEATESPRRDPPLRYYRDLLGELTSDQKMRDGAIALSLTDLYTDVPRIPQALRNCLRHIQQGLRSIATSNDAENVFMDAATRHLFETVERSRKGNRARLSNFDQSAARRMGFDRRTVGVYDIDYRWNQVRDLLFDLHRGLARA